MDSTLKNLLISVAASVIATLIIDKFYESKGTVSASVNPAEKDWWEF